MKLLFTNKMFYLWGHRSRGQIMVLFALLATVILLMMGAGLDVGLFYREKTRLSKALDGAAIRLANQISISDAQRQDVILTVLSSSDSRWSDIKWSGTTGVTSDGMSVKYDIEMFGPPGGQDAVRVSLSAVSKAPVFFTSLVGINDVKVASSSVAERYPGIIALILDVSGSMRGSRWSNMVQGAKDFVNNTTFDETRDRMAIFIFGSRAAPLYPLPDANGQVVPQKYFRAAANAELNKLWDGTNTRPIYGFNGSTSASEGMRIAFNAVERALPTNLQDRRLFKVSYVFLTDGQFNTFRTFAVGKEYGWNPATTSETTDGSSFTTSTLGRPSWHGEKLLSVGSGGWDQLTNFTRPGVVSSGTSAGPGPFDLKALIGDRDFSLMPGVSCTIHAQTFTTPGGTTGFGRWAKRPPSSAEPDSRFFWPHNWNNVIYNKNGTFFPIPSFNWSHDVDNPRPRRHDYMMTRKRVTGSTEEFNIFDNTDASQNYSDDQWARIRWEMLQLRYGYLLYMPSPIYNSTMNHSIRTGPNQSQANLNDIWLNYYSAAGRIYCNIYGSTVSTETGDARNRGVYIEQTNANGMTQKGEFNYNYWNRAMARLTDFYPSFYYGSEWSAISGTDKAWLANDLNWTAGQTPNTSGGWSSTPPPVNSKNPSHESYELRSSLFPHLGVPRYIYRPSRGHWTRFYGVYDPTNGRLRTNSNPLENKNSIDQLFKDEGNFLTEAQCWIARIQHKATVYTIAYEVSGVEEVLRRMANETTAGGAFYGDQRIGKYRAATIATIRQVFNEIASKIGVSITR